MERLLLIWVWHNKFTAIYHWRRFNKTLIALSLDIDLSYGSPCMGQAAFCMVEFDDFRVEGSPLLIMMGGADESMSIPGCQKFQKRLQKLGVDVELKVYETAGHGWDLPYPQEFQAGEWVTRDCVMKWTRSGRNKEMTSGYSMDSAYGAFMALAQCAHNDGYTMGYNEDATKRSLEDLLLFLRKTWGIDSGAGIQSIVQ